MTSISSEKPIVAVAQLRNFDTSGDFFERHAPLEARLRERGIGLIALKGKKDHIAADAFSTYYDFDHKNRSMDKVDATISVDSALDLSGGIARYTPAVPALNPIGVREIALSKQRQFDVLRPEFGHVVPETLLVPASKEAILGGLAKIDALKVILKPEKDYSKTHAMTIGTKDEVIAKLDSFLSGMDSEKNQVLIQEYMPEIRSGFAKGLRFYDETDVQAAAQAAGKDLELRVLMVDEEPKLVTGRLAADPENKVHGYATFFDQESVPSHVYDLATNVARAIRLGGQATDSLLAVDMTPDGSRVVEVNGRNIGTMRAYDSRPGSVEAARIMNDAIAQKLASMAHNKRGA